mgnify:CR=1 FL=1
MEKDQKNNGMKDVLLRATLDVVDRSATTMAAACLVAALLGTVIQPEKVTTAYVGAVIFFLVACAASALKAMMEIEKEDS